MTPGFTARIAHGRSIRDRALALAEAHGDAAMAEALAAADEVGISDAERYFWLAVADRLMRTAARPAGTDRFEPRGNAQVVWG